MTPTIRHRTSAADIAADEQHRAVEQEIIIEILRTDREEPHSHSELERRLPHIDPLALSDALARLQRRDVVRLDGETIEGRDVDELRQKVELLAAVVKYDLVKATPRALSVGKVAQGCERDLDKPDEREEVELALRLLVVDGLACRRADGWAATRPAVRSEQLSF